MGEDDARTIGFPVAGECWVLRPPGHGRWAYDVLPLAPGSTTVAEGGWGRYLTGRLRAPAFAGWGRTLLSPLDGEVLLAHDGEPDRERLLPWRDLPAVFLTGPLLHGRRLPAMAGNHVVVGAEGTYVLLAHLRRGSVRVRAGQRVREGERLGEMGASGNALGPHLHFQVMAGPDPLTARIVPFAVRRYEVREEGGWRERTDHPLPAERVRVRAGQPGEA